MTQASKSIENYLTKIDEEVNLVYDFCSKARKKGYDPEEKVDIPLAKGIAQRVEGLISAVAPQIMKSGVAERITKLEKEYGSLDWRVALKIAEEVALQKFCKFESKLKAYETGIRVGLAYVTLGVISAPLEGFIELRIKKRRDNKPYFSVFFAGPIRAAGGTAEAVSLIIADYVRIKTGHYPYDPTEKEIKRYTIEVRDYHEWVTNLQYLPSEQEIKFLVKHIPIEVNGDPTELIEVSNYKDLNRVETNRIRGGICLVLAEGLAQKAAKLQKRVVQWGEEFGLHWEFLKEFLEIQKQAKTLGKSRDKAIIVPNYTYIKDLVAGRPVLSFPMRYGGLRLRYGRTRTTGLAAAAIHPHTMKALNKFIAVGTQLKIERPGKATAVTVCNELDGPIVKFRNGTVKKVDNNTKYEEIESILYLGDILFNYGDFSENGHKLVPCGYCEEWWIKEFEQAAISLFGMVSFERIAVLLGAPEEAIKFLFKYPISTKVTARLAFKISNIFKIALHPAHTYFWTGITIEELRDLVGWLKSATIKKEDEKTIKIIQKMDQHKILLEKIGLPHLVVNNEYVVIRGEEAYVLYNLIINKKLILKEEVLDSLSTNIKIRDKAGTFIGARMGRPEKAKMRKLSGSPHFLFPVGEEGGRLRSIQSAFKEGGITAEFPVFFCSICKEETIFSICPTCNKKTKKSFYCSTCGLSEKQCGHESSKTYRHKKIDINTIFNKTMKNSKIKIFPDLIKGVRGTSNKDHVPEHLLKGILRAKHNIFVNKDGTTRYDMIELPITHFKPREIGTGIEELKGLGYIKDINGRELVQDDQILEIMPQDIILPACPDSTDEPADEVLFRVTNYLDDVLQKMYGLEQYYNLKSKKELVGHLVIGLAPHTSAGTVGRIIGFSKTQGMYAHPLFHAAMRRNCDGDESCVILLVDALLNFSRSFLPDKRGSRTMDAPLVLTSHLIPKEVDDEVHGMDIVWSYHLDFYKAAQELKKPWDVNITQINKTLNSPLQYEGMGYTHEVSSINQGVLCSAYKTLPTMEDKLKGQMELAEKIKAVNPSDVAQLVIEKHFLKDIKGNLRKFSTQQFRCVNCNTKYRRPPLIGRCIVCKGRIIFTISEGSIVKYLEPTISLATKYEVSPYLRQSLDFLKLQVDSILGKERERQEALGKWFG